MTEFKLPPAPPAFGHLPPTSAKEELATSTVKKSSDFYRAQKPNAPIIGAPKANLNQNILAKGIAPPWAVSKSNAASAKSFLVDMFFNENYKSPGHEKTLMALRDEAFSSGLPFFFVIKEIKDEKTGSLNIDAIPCSTFYEEVDRNDRRKQEGNTQVYFVKKGSKDAQSIGSINDVESEKNPLGHHLLMLNDEQFEIDDPENMRGATIAAASILFELGVCVPPDRVLAAGLMTLLSKDEQRFYIGRVMIDALLEEDYKCAEACLSHGGEVQSVDDHGHLAISCALRPAAADFLQKLLEKTATFEDVPILKATLKESPHDLDPAIRNVLTQNVMRLSRSEPTK